VSRVKSILTRDTGRISAACIKYQTLNLIARDTERSERIKWQTPRDPVQLQQEQAPN